MSGLLEDFGSHVSWRGRKEGEELVDDLSSSNEKTWNEPGVPQVVVSILKVSSWMIRLSPKSAMRRSASSVLLAKIRFSGLTEKGRTKLVSS